MATETDDLPELNGARVCRAADGKVAVEVDKNLVRGLAIAGVNLMQQHGLTPGTIAMAFIQAAWMVLEGNTDMPEDSRRDMMRQIVDGITNVPGRQEMQ